MPLSLATNTGVQSVVLCSCSRLLERPREEDRLSLEVSQGNRASLGFINTPWYSGDTWLLQPPSRESRHSTFSRLAHSQARWVCSCLILTLWLKCNVLTDDANAVITGTNPWNYVEMVCLLFQYPTLWNTCFKPEFLTKPSEFLVECIASIRLSYWTKPELS